MNDRVSHYMTTGIIDQHLKEDSRESDKCFVHNIKSATNEFRPLLFDDIIGVLVVLMSGELTLSPIIIIIELLIHKLTKKWDKQGLRQWDKQWDKQTVCAQTYTKPFYIPKYQ